jgi:predicted tellurium resistance membrane protein TerC
MHWLSDPQAWIALLTLTALEIVLGIDNIIFISILSGRLPQAQRNRGRLTGLALAMGMRILLLLSITWIMRLTSPLFTLAGHVFSGRDLILLVGGLFLIAKSTREIHHALEGEEERHASGQSVSFWGVIATIAVLDIVFSLDSVITAVGLARDVPVMIMAIIIAVLVMMAASRSISEFVERHPTIKMLALSFLILIGVSLLGDGLGFHIPKGYIYFAMAFSVLVEMLNLRVRSKGQKPVHLHDDIV